MNFIESMNNRIMRNDIFNISKRVIQNANIFLLFSVLVFSCKTLVAQQGNILDINDFSNDRLGRSFPETNNVSVEARYSLESRLEQIYSTKDGHKVRFLKDPNTDVITANIVYSSPSGFSKEEVLTVICEKDQDVLETLQTITLENSKYKIHLLGDRILIGNYHLCGGMPKKILPTIGCNDSCPNGCSANKCKHPRTDPPKQVFYQKGKRWDRGEDIQYEGAREDDLFDDPSDSFTRELWRGSLPTLAEIEENRVRTLQKIEDITLSSIKRNEESRRREEERSRKVEEDISEQDRNIAFLRKESKRQAPLSLSSSESFIFLFRSANLKRLDKSIRYLEKDIEAAKEEKTFTAAVKDKIKDVLTKIETYIEEVKPMYVDTKYAIDPRKYNLETREEDEKVIYNYLNDLTKRRDNLAEILINNKEDPENYGYNKDSLGLTPEYLKKERLKQENTLYTKWQEIYQTKNTVEELYLKIKEDENQEKINDAKEDLQDALAN